MPQVVEAFQYRNLVHLHFVGIEEFEAVSCYRIAGEHSAGGKHEVWIGASDYLVRNFRTEFHSGHRSDQIHRQIALNGDIPPEVFALSIVVSEAPANSA
jgi:hypothetical protein